MSAGLAPEREPQSVRRVVLDDVISRETCAELMLIARSLAVVGYRPGVCSATVFEVAAALPALLVPLVAAREAVRAAVEEALGLPLGLLVEFTGLICWRPGSSIGWHHDANRAYLQQRAFSAVCYLNTGGKDFVGGTFQFAGGTPQAVHAVPGRVVAYDAHEVHGVLPVASGERFTLTLWFTEDPAHSEDTKLLARLAGTVDQPPAGLPASMWLLPDGTDLRLCRLAMAGFGLVHEGRLLHSAEDIPETGCQLQIAVHPGVLREWLTCHQHAGFPATAASSGVDACSSAAAAPRLFGGVTFGSVQEAVLAIQHWMRQRCGLSWSTERVCCTHLNELPAADKPTPAPSCAWLRCCKLTGSPGQRSEGAGLLVAPEELQRALAASRAYIEGHGWTLRALQQQWLQLGAIFCDET